MAGSLLIPPGKAQPARASLSGGKKALSTPPPVTKAGKATKAAAAAVPASPKAPLQAPAKPAAKVAVKPLGKVASKPLIKPASKPPVKIVPQSKGKAAAVKFAAAKGKKVQAPLSKAGKPAKPEKLSKSAEKKHGHKHGKKH